MFEGLSLKHWKWTVRDNGLVHLIMDKQGDSTNSFSREAMRELGKLAERLRIEPPKGVVFLSGKENGFIAGADISEFEAVAAQDQAFETLRAGQKVFDQIEALPCPTVAAIDGFCMGGGTELALACTYRVASDQSGTRIGLPEVMLGIHPGWGGTVRLPRLIGAPKAMDLILSGRALRARAARKMGLVDRIVQLDELHSAAESMILERRKRHRPSPVDWLSNTWPARQVLSQVIAKTVKRKANPKHYPAPFAALELWRKYGGNPRRMMVAEAKSVTRLSRTPTARNLTRVFFLREEMRNLGDAKAAAISHVHVVGAGVMGGDIAAWCALRGMDVTLQDREAKFVQPALDRAASLFEKKLKDPTLAEAAGKRLQMDIAGDGVDKADLIIEAIFENLEAKQDLFAEVEPRMKADAILATNTSSIPLQDLREGMAKPERLVGLHFFNPVAKMPLLEIVKHDKLDEQVFERACGFAKAIDRLPVPVTSSPGFLVNRILMPYMLEAMMLYQEGVPGRVLDKAATAFGMPMGPIELADQVGLDVCASVSAVLSERLGFEVPDGLEAQVEGGKRGRKDGEGFYSYPEGKPVKPEIPEGYNAPDDITDRMILPFLNQAVRCLREGVVESPEMLDAGVIFGTGFAPFRGGPWQHIVDTGPQELKGRLLELQKKYGDRFAPDEGWDSLF
jgi:3-hydroxyacyl-CoA dehydrogenase/enoyl-CoA hydratase/3-hydroxybutyryl-CoA epimerase